MPETNASTDSPGAPPDVARPLTMERMRQPAVMPTSSFVSRRVIAAVVAGNALEFYDFVTYSFFAVYIGKTFFPATAPLTSLLLSVAVFGVGFFSRPLGGLLIGAYADRAGRKPAMLLTIGLMTIGTLGLALTPSYHSIGIAAPTIVVVCRLVQGLALGGEIGPSSAFLIEIAPPGRRGEYGSWQLASQGMALVAAGGLGLALTGVLSPRELQTWGWRVPFALALLLIPVAVYLRRQMPETSGHRTAADETNRALSLRQHSRLIMLAALVVLGGTVSTYVGMYMTTYAMTTLQFAPTVAMGATVVVGVTTLLFALLGGWLSDRFGRKPMMLIPRVLAALLTYPCFMLLIEQRSTACLFAVTAFLAALTAISGAASLAAIPELLPLEIRATAMSLAYAIGVALFGGTTQFAITWLIVATGNPAAPALYVAVTSVITVVAMSMLPESRDKPL